MKLLVTGGLGFIGSNFIEYILNKNPSIEIVNIDKCDYMAREKNVSVHPRYTYIRADITERYHMTHIFKEHQPQVVIHFAAQSCVDRSFDQSFQFTKDNVLGTHVLLDTAKDYGELDKFIHISTDEVYGEVPPGTVSCETSPLNPSNPYSASKAAAELYVKAYMNGYNLPCIITRGNNVFGPKQYPEKVVPLFISKILSDEPCPVHGSGETRRNFIYVDDVARAVETILEKGQVGQTYNIGSSHEYSVNEIFNKIQKMTGRGSCVHVRDRQFNDSRYCIDSSSLRALGWSEDADFDGRLKDTVEWYRAHPEWYLK
jgi:dTDP-glucose 4,6-dehydratase